MHLNIVSAKLECQFIFNVCRFQNDYASILADEAVQRGIIKDELTELVTKFGDERRTQIVPDEDEVSMADLIAERDVVITITRDGYAKPADAKRDKKQAGQLPKYLATLI